MQRLRLLRKEARAQVDEIQAEIFILQSSCGFAMHATHYLHTTISYLHMYLFKTRENSIIFKFLEIPRHIVVTQKIPMFSTFPMMFLLSIFI